ncbi:MAG: hypothetical protein QF530_10925 [SAR202 cluster bacterium]|jgi:hypothetical protein|nr:hypothetical protein [SAR202 cluster bacterium]
MLQIQEQFVTIVQAAKRLGGRRSVLVQQKNESTIDIKGYASVPVVAILALALWTSCTIAEPAGIPDDTGPTIEYFKGDQDLDADPCPGAPVPLDINAALAVQIYRGSGVTDADLINTASRIDDFFRLYGIIFSTGSPPGEISNQTIIGGSAIEIEEALAWADVDASSLEGRLISAKIVYYDLRTFLNTHAIPSQPQINIVLLNDITRSDSVAWAVVGDLVGLAFSPELVQVVNDSDPIIVDALGVEGDFTPTVFLSASRLRKMTDLEATVVIAHDIAHAMGLSHDLRTWNLMHEHRTSCLPGLAPTQIEQIKSSQIVQYSQMKH